MCSKEECILLNLIGYEFTLNLSGLESLRSIPPQNQNKSLEMVLLLK